MEKSKCGFFSLKLFFFSYENDVLSVYIANKNANTANAIDCECSEPSTEQHIKITGHYISCQSISLADIYLLFSTWKLRDNICMAKNKKYTTKSNKNGNYLTKDYLPRNTFKSTVRVDFHCNTDFYFISGFIWLRRYLLFPSIQLPAPPLTSFWWNYMVWYMFD